MVPLPPWSGPSQRASAERTGIVVSLLEPVRRTLSAPDPLQPGPGAAEREQRDQCRGPDGAATTVVRRSFAGCLVLVLGLFLQDDFVAGKGRRAGNGRGR